MATFKSIPLTITEYQPLHDEVLVTLKSIESGEEDIVDTRKTNHILYVQEIVKVGHRVPKELDLNEGDQVHIDTTSVMRDPQKFQESVVILGDDVENPYMLIPTRYIKAKVTAELRNFLEEESTDE